MLQDDLDTPVELLDHLAGEELHISLTKRHPKHYAPSTLQGDQSGRQQDQSCQKSDMDYNI